MTKTIEQLAKESLKEKGYILISLDGKHMAKIEATVMFKRGANAILKLFEEIICDDSFLHANRVHRAKELIKQLKGE